MWILKPVKGMRFTFLQATVQPPSLIDAGRKYEMPGSDRLLLRIPGNMSFMFAFVAQIPKSHGGYMEWPKWTLYTQWAYITAE